MNRTSGKTFSDAYIEFITEEDANTAIETRNKTILKGRIVTISKSSQKELMKSLFPSWADKILNNNNNNNNSSSSCSNSTSLSITTNNTVSITMGTGIIYGRMNTDYARNGCFLTRDEVNAILLVCKNYKLHFSRKCAERPFENVISIISKIPWHIPKIINTLHRDHIFELLKLSLESLKTHLSKEYTNISPTLMNRLIRSGLCCPGFTDKQKNMILNFSDQKLPKDIELFINKPEKYLDKSEGSINQSVSTESLSLAYPSPPHSIKSISSTTSSERLKNKPKHFDDIDSMISTITSKTKITAVSLTSNTNSNKLINQKRETINNSIPNPHSINNKILAPPQTNFVYSTPPPAPPAPTLSNFIPFSLSYLTPPSNLFNDNRNSTTSFNEKSKFSSFINSKELINKQNQNISHPKIFDKIECNNQNSLNHKYTEETESEHNASKKSNFFKETIPTDSSIQAITPTKILKEILTRSETSNKDSKFPVTNSIRNDSSNITEEEKDLTTTIVKFDFNSNSNTTIKALQSIIQDLSNKCKKYDEQLKKVLQYNKQLENRIKELEKTNNDRKEDSIIKEFKINNDFFSPSLSSISPVSQ
ncbi:hypothetical protein H8356DRAFT_929016 [Neocallimastix lanati (nom. inval.)]|uniref:RRM domain-containing protein n=1 Tax=Neocallimastix californiae TaxID=1754190 RepID=A0A1Y2F9N9_9FUNG|nr:hypothetical protein H8356DRAFT_929016 [Neocallimastix sp. JGI-2020a]ORY80642.1 hypothetical protein LY90DRAFT_664507 [Neocallimastix californiae]|eukprot:ORY80642.1 hypothetical protein LY90DRAFT_664507 [Neocallimastix californiae]